MTVRRVMHDLPQPPGGYGWYYQWVMQILSTPLGVVVWEPGDALITSLRLGNVEHLAQAPVPAATFKAKFSYPEFALSLSWGRTFEQLGVTPLNLRLAEPGIVFRITATSRIGRVGLIVAEHT